MKAKHSEIYLEMCKAVDVLLEQYLQSGSIARVQDCAAVFEFSQDKYRKLFACDLSTTIEQIADSYNYSSEAKDFLVKHFLLKLTGNNIVKNMIESMCFEPRHTMPVSALFVAYSHIAHEFPTVGQLNSKELNQKLLAIVNAINQVVDVPIAKVAMQGLEGHLKSEKNEQNIYALNEFIELHKRSYGSEIIDHTFLWIKPERLIVDPVVDESQMRQDFSELFGEFMVYVMKQHPGFKPFSEQILKTFMDGGSNGILNTALGSFCIYPLLVFLSADDNAQMVQKLGEGTIQLMFATFATSLNVIDDGESYQVQMIPFMSLNSVDKKTATNYLATFLDWNRSFSFGLNYFTRGVAFSVFDQFNEYVSSVFPIGLITLQNGPTAQYKDFVWKAYEKMNKQTTKRKFKSIDQTDTVTGRA